MRAPRAEAGSEIVDLVLERTGSSRAVDEINRAKPRLARQTSKAGKAPARQKLIAEIREGCPRRTRNGRSGSMADAISAQGRALAETRAEVAGVRAQLAELEAEKGRLKAQFFRLGEERHDTERSSIERVVKSLGDQLGSALAEKSAADLRAEQAQAEAAELRELLDGRSSEWDGERAVLVDERAQSAAERAQLADALAILREELAAVTGRAKESAEAAATVKAQA